MFCKRLILAAVAIAPLWAGQFDVSVRNDFFAGFLGDNAALERAMQASAGEPSPEAMAWHGGGLMVLSGREFQKGNYAAGGELWSKAIAEMDKAGALEPDNPAVLIPRAAVWFAASRQVPPVRAVPLIGKAIADYEHVYEMQKTYFDTLDIHMRSELLFGLADGYARVGNAEKARFYFEKLAALGPASGHLEQARQYANGERYTVQGIGCVGCHASGATAGK